MTRSLETIRPEPATSPIETVETEVGSVFVSNYPPYSFWSAEQAREAHNVLMKEAVSAETPVGLYLHIPFCRKRCKFCYFRVYTEKNSSDVQRYLDALSKEVQIFSELPAIQGRSPKFVYFGGGTPSFISAKHLRSLVRKLKKSISWDSAREITFECEPGTLTQAKLQAIREIGVTRLSLGIENFDDAILEENGRAHHSTEIYRVLPWIRSLDFDQLNVDLIAGMIGETWDTWRDTVQKTIDIAPDSITIYQMELPFNTVFSDQLFHNSLKVPIANWQTKREWHQFAFEKLAEAGYTISSAYTMKKDPSVEFVYRDSVWHGCDMMGTGVASFSHMGGIHFQNHAGWNEYMDSLKNGELPIQRAFVTSARIRFIREMILQLKLGEIQAAYFYKKFQMDILREFAETFNRLERAGALKVGPETVRLTRNGLLKVDHLLPEFYDAEYRNARYT